MSQASGVFTPRRSLTSMSVGGSPMLFDHTFPTFVCLVCGGTFYRDRIDRKWCPGCKAKGLAAYKAEQRKKTGTVSIGTILTCKNCGKEYAKVHKRQRHCEVCSALSTADKLPAYI